MFGNDLATSAAGGCGTGACYRKEFKIDVSFGESLKDDDALGAAAEAVTGALYVGAGDGGAVGGLEGGTNFELAVGGVGALPSGEGGLDKVGVVIHGAWRIE